MAVEMDNDEFVCSVPFDPYVLVLDVGYLTTPRQTGQIRHCRSFALSALREEKNGKVWSFAKSPSDRTENVRT